MSIVHIAGRRHFLKPAEIIEDNGVMTVHDVPMCVKCGLNPANNVSAKMCYVCDDKRGKMLEAKMGMV